MKLDLRDTSTRTFVLWPLVAGVQSLARRRPVDVRYLPVCLCGYVLYQQTGLRRNREGGGGPGMQPPPQRLVTTGIYGVTRNPMYIGHLLMYAGIALVTRSALFGAVLGWHLRWFDERAQSDQTRLASLFGEEYLAYRDRVPRWLLRRQP
jgi:protein-S-isoprenylcysteine O-methyltransferase Ste14